MATEKLNDKYKKYYSTYSGEEIDESVAYTQDMKRTSTFTVAGRTIDNKVDLNKIIKPGIYVIHYYQHSIDDTRSSLAIKMEVLYIDDSHIRQQYMYSGKQVSRVYNKTEDKWSEWTYTGRDTIILKNEDDKVSVASNTLIMRPYTIKKHPLS